MSAPNPDPPTTPDFVRAPALYLDDRPLVASTRNEAVTIGSPVCAMERLHWLGDRSEPCARAVGALVAAAPELLDESFPPAQLRRCLELGVQACEKTSPGNAEALSRWWFALARLAEKSGELSRAANYLRLALYSCLQGDVTLVPKAMAIQQKLKALEGQIDQSDRFLALDQATLFLVTANASGFFSSLLREVALQAYMSGNYEGALLIYDRLAAVGFSLASTHCHRARAFFLLNRPEEAEMAIAAAWACRHSADPYVQARILFLRALSVAWRGDDPTEPLESLREALSRPECHTRWEIYAVVEQLRTGLPPELLPTYLTIAEVLNEIAPRSDLATIPGWRAPT